MNKEKTFSDAPQAAAGHFPKKSEIGPTLFQSSQISVRLERIKVEDEEGAGARGTERTGAFPEDWFTVLPPHPPYDQSPAQSPGKSTYPNKNGESPPTKMKDLSQPA